MAETTTGAPLNLTKHDTDDDNWGAAQNTNHDVINQFADDTNTALATKADSSAVTAGDATTLAAAETYADGVVATEAAARIAADASKAPIASPALTGTPTAPTATPGDNTTKIATTAFVAAATAAGGAVTSVAGRTGAVVIGESDVTGLVSDLAAKAPSASPALTGNPTAPTPSVDDNDTSISTTAFVIGQLSASGDGTPGMNGVAARGTSIHGARADHIHPVDTSRAATSHTHIESDVTGLVSDLASKAPLASPALTGTPTAPTASALDNTTKLATTAYADAAVAAEGSVRSNADALLAPKASPALTGTPTAPTASALTNNTQLATTAYADTADALKQSLTGKDAASGYAGLDADTQVKDIELPSWLIEGMNNGILKGATDGSGNPNYGAISTVSTVATFKFVCATVNLELYIDSHYQKVADDNVVNVVLVNGVDSTHPAANFVYLKKNAAVKQLTASDIGVTSKAPIFGNNQTVPAVYAGADKQFYFNPMTNKWMSSTGNAAYVNDPIIPVVVAVIDNTGVELGKAYWGPRMTPWKVMELFGQGTDGARHNQTGTVPLATGQKQYTSFIVSGGSITGAAVASVQVPLFLQSQAPIVICGGGSANSDGKGAAGGAAANNAASNVGTAGTIGGAGGGGGGSTARAGAVSGTHDSINLNSSSAAGGTTAPTAGGNGVLPLVMGVVPLITTQV
jgi:hypothetical protein